MTYVCDIYTSMIYDWRMMKGNAEKTAPSKIQIQLIGG